MTRPSRVLISGATGFAGAFVVREFARHSDRFTVAAFARSAERVAAAGLEASGAKVHYGSFEDRESFCRALEGQDIYVHLVSLGFGHAPTVLDCCRLARVRRGVFVSTTAIFTDLDPESKVIRLEAEARIRDSGMDYTIIRPTMIFGTDEDRNMSRLIRHVARWPVVPVPGPGTSLMQPVHAADLAKAIVAAASTSIAIGREYNVSGADPITYNQTLDLIAELLGRRVLRVHVPLRLMIPLFWLYERLMAHPRLSVEKLYRLNEDRAFSNAEARQDLGFETMAFREGISREIDEMTNRAPSGDRVSSIISRAATHPSRAPFKAIVMANGR